MSADVLGHANGLSGHQAKHGGSVGAQDVPECEIGVGRILARLAILVVVTKRRLPIPCLGASSISRGGIARF